MRTAVELLHSAGFQRRRQFEQSCDNAVHFLWRGDAQQRRNDVRAGEKATTALAFPDGWVHFQKPEPLQRVQQRLGNFRLEVQRVPKPTVPHDHDGARSSAAHLSSCSTGTGTGTGTGGSFAATEHLHHNAPHLVHRHAVAVSQRSQQSVLGDVQQDVAGRPLAVTPSAAGLLHKVFQTAGQVKVHDRPDVGLVDAHSECDGGHDDADAASHERVLHTSASGRRQPAVVAAGGQPAALQIRRQRACAVLCRHVHNDGFGFLQRRGTQQLQQHTLCVVAVRDTGDGVRQVRPPGAPFQDTFGGDAERGAQFQFGAVTSTNSG